MNPEYAQSISLRDILSKLNAQTAQQTNGSANEPFLTALVVDPVANRWHDVASGQGDGSLELIAAYLRHHNKPSALSDVLHWLRFNIGYPRLSAGLNLPAYGEQDAQFQFRYKMPVLDGPLQRYLLDRGIGLALGRQAFKQICVLNRANGKEFQALGFKNEEGGYAIRNPAVKAMLGPRAVSFIRGRTNDGQALHVFKDIFDCLSVIIKNGGPLEADSLILHSYDCLDNSTGYIRGYGYRTLYTWLDNDSVSQRVTKAYGALCASEPDLEHLPQNWRYVDYPDVNAWHIAERFGEQ